MQVPFSGEPLVFAVSMSAAVLGSSTAPIMLHAGGLLDGGLAVAAVACLAAGAVAAMFSMSRNERAVLFTLLGFMVVPPMAAFGIIIVAA